MQNSAILRINAEKDYINIDPEYQREGGVWGLEKRQLLIDSILNDYDIPKIYFHVLVENSNYKYAVIDGRQRLEAIWGFIEDKFPLASEFVFQADEKVKAGGLKYSELASQFPKLKINIDSFTLPIVLVETDDIDLIEDMFSRLNEAVPLNASEKRNAFGGEMAKAIRDVSTNCSFFHKLRVSNKRLQHQEILTRIFFVEDTLNKKGKILDTKKPFLDAMVRDYRDGGEELNKLTKIVQDVLDGMSEVFMDGDTLLKNQAPVLIYYLVFKAALLSGFKNRFSRLKLEQFNKDRSENKIRAEEDITKADYALLEYDRLMQQGTNDSSSIKIRYRTLCDYLGIPTNALAIDI